jgi:glucose/arabinose dehydrogenase
VPRLIETFLSWALLWPASPALLAWGLLLGLLARPRPQPSDGLGAPPPAARDWRRLLDRALLGLLPLALAALAGSFAPGVRASANSGFVLVAALLMAALHGIGPRLERRPAAVAALVLALLAGALTWAPRAFPPAERTGLLLGPALPVLAAALLAGRALLAAALAGPRRLALAAAGVSGLLAILALLAAGRRVLILEAALAATALVALLLAEAVRRLPPRGPARALACLLLALGIGAWTFALGRGPDPGEHSSPPGLPFRPGLRVDWVYRGLQFASGIDVDAGGRVFVAEHASGELIEIEGDSGGPPVAGAGSARSRVLARVPLPSLDSVRFYAVEAGLWGLRAHPSEPWLYAMAIERLGPAPGWFGPRRPPVGSSRLVRVRTDRGRATPAEPETVFSGLPAGAVHSGGALAFAPDGTLFLSVGDSAGPPEPALDPASRVGAILRLRADGSTPEDNPLPGLPTWAWGFRNPYGLGVDPGSGALYATENGPECCDRLLRVERGRYHGWGRYGRDVADAAAMGQDSAVVPPLFDSGRHRIAPTGLAIAPPGVYGADAELLFGAWHTMALHRVTLGRDGLPKGHEIVARGPRGALEWGDAPDAAASEPLLDGPVTGLARGPDGTLWICTLHSVGRVVALPPPLPALPPLPPAH